MKKSVLVLLALAVALVATGCSKKTVASASAATETKTAKLKVGVIQLVEHPALDGAYQGFVDGLADAGYKNGENISIDYQNAQGEQANCVTIANKLVNDKDDLILAIATPAAQAVAQLTQTIPVLITAVTDPESAKLVQSNTHPGNNVTGTSDLTPVSAQIDLLKRVVPNAKTVGLMFCSSEQNSIFQIQLAKDACTRSGLKYIEGSVSNSNEIQQVTQSLVGKVDAIYVPTDNMLAAGMPLLAQVANEAKIPTIVGEDGMVKSGGMVTYGINYYELGKQTAAMAVKVLKGEANPADMPIEYLEKCDLSYNSDSLAKVGITLPKL
ncbi:MAG: ABC transporter substrate-binding protein [Treponema sp.]|nr:ABC transporter substrate-binding protein [Treponema sp.]